MIPSTDATTQPPTRPSSNVMDEKLEGGGGGWGMSGENPWDAAAACMHYVDHKPHPTCMESELLRSWNEYRTVRKSGGEEESVTCEGEGCIGGIDDGVITRDG